MKTLLTVSILAGIFALTGCAFLQNIGLAPEKTPQTAAEYVREGKVLLIGIVKTAGDNVTAGIMSPAARDSIIVDVEKYRADLQAVQALIDAGNEAGALQRARITRAAITALRQKLNPPKTQGVNDENRNFLENYRQVVVVVASGR